MCSCVTAPSEPGPRPETWATPIENEDLPNLHRVAPGLWRGAQPSADGFRALERLGVRTVVSLRSFSRDQLPDDVELDLVEIPMHAWSQDDEDVVRFLQVATDPARAPVFVHCLHGADRTGLACATYRVVIEGWSKEDALREMQSGNFGFHTIWGGIPEYLRELDVDRIRARIDRPPR